MLVHYYTLLYYYSQQPKGWVSVSRVERWEGGGGAFAAAEPSEGNTEQNGQNLIIPVLLAVGLHSCVDSATMSCYAAIAVSYSCTMILVYMS